MPRPTVPWTIEKLEAYHGRLPLKPVLDPLEELVQTILSQNTSDINSSRAYAELRARFPGWQDVTRASDKEVADAIRSGGLGDIKAPRIKAVLAEVAARTGGYSLGFLGELPLDEAKRWLTGLPGVGPKTAACVLLFSLGRPALPVDTHVLRVSSRLGLVPPNSSAEKAEDILERKVQPGQVYQFHLLLIQHGRTLCRARRPRCAECVLNDRCPSAFKVG